MIAIKMSLIVCRDLQSAAQYLLLEAATQVQSRSPSLTSLKYPPSVTPALLTRTSTPGGRRLRLAETPRLHMVGDVEFMPSDADAIRRDHVGRLSETRFIDFGEREITAAACKRNWDGGPMALAAPVTTAIALFLLSLTNQSHERAARARRHRARQDRT